MDWSSQSDWSRGNIVELLIWHENCSQSFLLSAVVWRRSEDGHLRFFPCNGIWFPLTLDLRLITIAKGPLGLYNNNDWSFWNPESRTAIIAGGSVNNIIKKKKIPNNIIKMPNLIVDFWTLQQFLWYGFIILELCKCQQLQCFAYVNLLKVHPVW